MHIPPELVERILLLGLPVKLLLRFMCVSKLWHDIISSKKFKELHARFLASCSSYHTLRHQRILTFSPVMASLGYNALGGGDVNQQQQAADKRLFTDLPQGIHNGCAEPIGACDGLICIHNKCKSICVWNPSTNKSKLLKCPNFPTTMHGFGRERDASTGRFKVVIVSCGFSRKETMVAYVNTLNVDKNKWRKIQAVGDFLPFYSYTDKIGTYLNGILHWPTYRYVITSFDLEHERFLEIQGPGVLSSASRPHPCADSTLGVLGECLIAINRVSIDEHEFWIMKEYGVKESWIKQCVILAYQSLPRTKFLGAFENGDLLLDINQRSLQRYDPLRDTAKVITVRQNRGGEPASALTYRETLFSPDEV